MASVAAAEQAGFVTVSDVTKFYLREDEPLHAVDHVSLSVAQNEFVSVLGPSGCGKSTLLMMISGLIRASGGKITIAGRDVDRPYTDLGIVFQQDALLEWRTVLDNVLLQVQIRGLDRHRYAARADALLKLVGLRDFANRHPFELSGGMRQRAAICRALVHDPPILLMDEPFGALDALTRDQLNLDLQAIWDRDRKTVVFVTHSIAEAVFLSDRVFVMSPRPGRIDEVLKIDLPRPRGLHIRESNEFSAYTRRIRSLFEASGILSDIQPGPTDSKARAYRY